MRINKTSREEMGEEAWGTSFYNREFENNSLTRRIVVYVKVLGVKCYV